MIVGITGTIGSGKSTLVNYLKSKGFKVFDCDKYNALLLKKDNEVFAKLQRAFPSCIKNNKINKNLLASLIFDDENARRKLENILHPLILKKIKEEYQKEKKNLKPYFVEVPLLFEVGWQKHFDQTLLVVCNQKIALSRLVERGMDEKDAKKRIQIQMSVREKRKIADNVIYNNKGLDVFYAKVDKWIQSLC